MMVVACIIAYEMSQYNLKMKFISYVLIFLHLWQYGNLERQRVNRNGQTNHTWSNQFKIGNCVGTMINIGVFFCLGIVIAIFELIELIVISSK